MSLRFFQGVGWALSAAVGAFGLVAQSPAPLQQPTSAPSVPASLTPAPDAAGSGNIAIFPPRLVLEGNKRSGEILLLNTGTAEGRYQLSFMHYRMDEKGTLLDITSEPRKAGEIFADELVRFSPREVVLKPGESQSIRFQVRKPANLPEGEYRAHILVKEVSGSTQPSIESHIEKGKVSLRLRPDFGFAMPIIIRHGKLSGVAGLDEWKVSKTPEGADATGLITLTGRASVFGDLDIFVEKDGKRRPVGAIHGVAVYPPNANRPMTLHLNGTPDELLQTRLVVRYTVLEDGKDKSSIEAVIDPIKKGSQ